MIFITKYSTDLTQNVSPLIPSGIWGMKGGNFWVWYFFMYLFLPHNIFHFNLQVDNKRNFRSNWDDFLFDDHQTKHIIINWRTFPNFWHHWWKEKFGRYEKMIIFFVSQCQEDNYVFLRCDTNNILYSIGCTLSNFWKLFYFTNHWSDVSKTFQELTW